MPDKPSSDPQPPGSTPPARPAHPQLPEPRELFGWLYLGRVLVATALLIRVSWGLEERLQLMLPAVSLFALAVMYTAVAFWHTHRQGRRPGQRFVYAQILFDALLISVIVYLTGGPESIFSPLYVLVICAAALLLPIAGGMLVGLLISGLYLVAVWSATGTLGGSVYLQVALFAVVTLVTGYLGDRLRRTGTALGEVQTELRQLRLDTSDILSTISTGILTVDGDGLLAYINPAAEEILSLSSDEWLGRPVLDMLDQVAPGLGRVIARSASSRVAIRRFETERLSDEGFVLGVSTTLVESARDERPAVTAIFQDITEKMRVEALRRRAERLEAIAELSASLAHEIKNPLASIRSATEQISSDAIDPDDSRLLKDLVVRESDRLSRLLAEFIDFARVQVTAPQRLDLGTIVAQVVELAREHPDARERGVQIRLEPAAEPLWIRGAEDLLHRAVLNLVLNGVQWAGQGGCVTLSLDEVRSDLLSPALGALSLVRLTVTDTGPGVPAEIVDQIFDPFFTRRPGGAGLGLALVQRAVEAHGGAIFVDNAPASIGRGATFTLYLPALPPEALATTTAQSEETRSL